MSQKKLCALYVSLQHRQGSVTVLPCEILDATACNISAAFSDDELLPQRSADC